MVILSVDAVAARDLSIYNKGVNVQATDVEVVDDKRTHASAPECQSTDSQPTNRDGAICGGPHRQCTERHGGRGRRPRRLDILAFFKVHVPDSFASS